MIKRWKSRDKEMVWMLYVWDSVHVKESDVKLEQFIGYLKFKFKETSIQFFFLYFKPI